MWEPIKLSRSYKALDYFRENHHLCDTCLNKLPQKNTYAMSYMEDGKIVTVDLELFLFLHYRE